MSYFQRLSLEQRTGVPRVVQGPDPGFIVKCDYHLRSPGEVALVYSFPTGVIRVGPHRVIDLAVTNPGVAWPSAKHPTVHMALDHRIALPLSAVEAVQAARAKGAVDLDVSIDIHPNLGVLVAGGSGLTEAVHDNLIQLEPVRLSRDAWLRLIGELRFTETLVIELPVSLATGGGVDPEVRRHLSAARSAFAAGGFDAVTVSSYKALEALVPGYSGPLYDAIQSAYFANAAPEVGEQAKVLLAKLAPLLHEGRHHRLGEVARHHARFVLGMTELVVAWCLEARG